MKKNNEKKIKNLARRNAGLNLKPQFKELRFRSLGKFADWLVENTAYTVTFEDKQQDLLTMQVHASGEIINCNAQQGVWLGKFAPTEKLNKGLNLFMYPIGDCKDWKEMDFVIESVTKGYTP